MWGRAMRSEDFEWGGGYGTAGTCAVGTYIQSLAYMVVRGLYSSGVTWYLPRYGCEDAPRSVGG